MSPGSFDPQHVQPIRRALISVSDKSGLIELARALAGAGVLEADEFAGARLATVGHDRLVLGQHDRVADLAGRAVVAGCRPPHDGSSELRSGSATDRASPVRSPRGPRRDRLVQAARYRSL